MVSKTKHKSPQVFTVKMAAQSFNNAREHVMTKLSEHMDPVYAKEMERSVLDYTKKSCALKRMEMLCWSDITVRRLYLRKFRAVLSNVQSLLKLVENKDIAVCEVAFVDPQQMRPDIYTDILDAIDRREKLTTLVDADEDEGYQGLLKCEACGSFRTTYVTLQTRSADEPETIYMRCFQCGNNDTIRG